MNTNTAAEDFAKLLKQELQTLFISETVFPRNWQQVCLYAIRYESCISLNCDLETIRCIVRGQRDCYTVSFAVNMLQSKSPQQMGMDVEGWLSLQERVSEVAECWNNLVQPIKVKIGRSIAARERIKTGGMAAPIGIA